jgi:hypothetical protein
MDSLDARSPEASGWLSFVARALETARVPSRSARRSEPADVSAMTSRERVWLMLIAHARQAPLGEALIGQLRADLVETECQPTPTTLSGIVR